VFGSRPMDLSLARYQAVIESRVSAVPAATEILEICLIAESGHTKRESILLPANWVSAERDNLLNYCAAFINNITMTLGGVAVECWCSNPDLVRPILQRLDDRYPQVRQILSDYHGCQVEIRHVLSRNDLTEDRSSNATSDEWPAFSDESGLAVGINIGQTLMKLATIRDGSEHERMVVQTWDENKERSFANLLDRTLQTLGDHLSTHALENRVDAIGVAIGGIVHDGYVTSKSGIAAQMSDNDFEQLRNLAGIMQERLGVVTLLTQDVIAKAYALRSRYRGRPVLVLDLGTSTGGAFIDANGAIPDFLNQVGRVVVDLSENAIPRDDHKAVGVLSKYLSLTSCGTISRTCGLDGMSLDAIAHLTTAKDPRATRFLETLAETLVEDVIILNRYYEADIAVLTGGVVTGQFGSLLMIAAKRRASEMGAVLPQLEISNEPIFEGSIGVARMAIARQKVLSAAPLLVRTLLRESRQQRIPEVVANDNNRLGQTVMDSPLGRDYYIDYNERFLRGYLPHTTRDSCFAESLTRQILPEISNLREVGLLSPQQVQSVVVRTAAGATGNKDPFWLQKQKSNFIASECAATVAEQVKAELETSPSHRDFTSSLKMLLLLAASLNFFEFFNSDVFSKSPGTDGSNRHKLSAEAIQQCLDCLTDDPSVSVLLHDEFEPFAQLLVENPNCSVMYFLDNAGEAIFDLQVVEFLLAARYKVNLVAGLMPFVDDVTVAEVDYFVQRSKCLNKARAAGRLTIAGIDSDLAVWPEPLLAQWQTASVYVAKGMRKLNQLYSPHVRLPGLHVVVNKSDTARRIVLESCGRSLPKEPRSKVIFIFRAPSH
jgi:uncharacterized protein with ATP-grasp and redox domains/predicted NBD/HSP70 family sugar kinase